MDMSSQTLLPIDGEHAVCQANDRWAHTLWAPAQSAMTVASGVHQQNRHGSIVRAIPDDVRDGFKVLKSATWFIEHPAPPEHSNTGAFPYHWCGMVHKWSHVRTLAKFRLGMHWLRTETDHTGPRSLRLCPLCPNAADREDELHVFVCPAYVHIRYNFPVVFGDQLYGDVVSAYNNKCPNIDDIFKSMMMNQPGPTFWTQLADFLIQAQTIRCARISEMHN